MEQTSAKEIVELIRKEGIDISEDSFKLNVDSAMSLDALWRAKKWCISKNDACMRWNTAHAAGSFIIHQSEVIEYLVQALRNAQESNNENSTFWIPDGVELDMDGVTCAKCGRWIKHAEDLNYCPRCGRKVKANDSY